MVACVETARAVCGGVGLRRHGVPSAASAQQGKGDSVSQARALPSYPPTPTTYTSRRRPQEDDYLRQLLANPVHHHGHPDNALLSNPPGAPMPTRLSLLTHLAHPGEEGVPAPLPVGGAALLLSAAALSRRRVVGGGQHGAHQRLPLGCGVHDRQRVNATWST